MSINGPINPPSDDEEWDGCVSDDNDDEPTVPTPLAPYNNDTPEATIDALQDTVNAFAKGAGYAVSRFRGKKAKKKGDEGYIRFHFYCTRGGPSYGSTAKIRDTTTIKCDCPYLAVARKTDEGWRWEQHPNPTHCEHNHPPALNATAFRQNRKLLPPHKALIKEFDATAAVKTRELSNIMATKFPDLNFTKRDINNARAALRAEEMDGHSASGAVIKAFDEEGIIYEAFWDDTNTILQGIVFSFPETEEVWKRFGNCLGADNTYATNCLDFPLMVITTMTNINTVANVAFALMREESVACFTTLFQGLERIRARIGAPTPNVVITDQDEKQKAALLEVWPNTQQQLCRYHINKNVALHSKKKWVNDEGIANGNGDEAQQQADEA